MSQTEDEVKNDVLLETSKQGMRMWRNNVGVAKRKDGTPVRYGLANVTSQMNKNLKSSDLIGITPVVITPDMVGKTVGIFTAIETKRSDWIYKGKGREVAQNRYLELVRSLGGHAIFCNNVEDLK